MDKYVECQNCQEQYDCERTYLGGCTDGKEWKEKKLTNDEIVKALEHCFHNRSCEYCYHNDEVGSGEIVCRSRLMGKILDLIHRLQSENRLKDECIDHLNRDKLLLQNKKAEQKAEIETLKSELRKECEEHEGFTKKAKAEIKRLTERKEYFEIYATELQKQVDELKKRLVDEFETFKVEAYGKVKQQAEKNTAKEIISWLVEKDKQGMTRPFDMVLRQLKERYGVEVE